MERGRAEFGRAFELLWEQKSFILQRFGDFTGLVKEALVLESFVSQNLTRRDGYQLTPEQSKNEIETTKDRHDSAIYAFTIVTIIFLPLSFVCSFLGMNTTGKAIIYLLPDVLFAYHFQTSEIKVHRSGFSGLLESHLLS